MQKRQAQAILKKVYPHADPYRPPFALVASSLDISEAIRASHFIRSSAVDRAVLRLFRTVSSPKAMRLAERRDLLMVACIRRLAGRGWDRELAARAGERIRELETRERTRQEEADLERLKARLELLRRRDRQPRP